MVPSALYEPPNEIPLMEEKEEARSEKWRVTVALSEKSPQVGAGGSASGQVGRDYDSPPRTERLNRAEGLEGTGVGADGVNGRWFGAGDLPGGMNLLAAGWHRRLPAMENLLLAQ